MEYQEKKKENRSTITLPKKLNVKVVQKLLAKHPIDVNTFFKQYDGYRTIWTTFIHSAIKKKNVELIDWLLTQGIDINIVPLLQGPPIHVAIKERDLETVKKLVSRGANPNFRDSQTGRTPFSVAIECRANEIAKYLIENGADVNILPHQDEYRYKGQSSLQICIQWPDIEMTKYLLSKGANVNYKSSNGSTPLTCAAQRGNPEIFKLLVDNGADINSTYVDCNETLTLLHAAIECENEEIVRFLCNLDEPVSDVNILTAKKKQSMLHFACKTESKFKCDEVIDYLLIAGVDVNVEDSDGKLAIDMLFEWNDLFLTTHLVKLLLADLPVCQRNADKVKGKWIEFGVECRQDVAKMKSTKIGDGNITFYDVLHLSNHSLAKRVKCLETDYNLEENKEKLWEMFPKYEDILTFKLAKAQRRMRRCIKAEEEIMKIFVCLGLSFDVCKEMLCYLHDSDLKKIIGEKIIS